MTTTDETALLAAIAAHPEEDTPRLVFADWLDENPKVPCPHCGGGRPGCWHFALNSEGGCATCGRRGCNGDGLVDDGSRRDLATFIRLQHEIASWGAVGPEEARKAGVMLKRVRKGAPVPLKANTPAVKLVREQLLREKYEREWRKAGECRNCCGAKRVQGTVGSREYDLQCIVCDGCGDRGQLLREWTIEERHDAGLLTGTERFKYKVHFRCGFIDKVECRLEDAARDDEGGDWEATGRVIAWCRWFPVTRIVLTDRVPIEWRNGLFKWYRSVPLHPDELVVPEFLTRKLLYREFKTAELAHAALGEIVAAWVRGHLGGDR